jgi:hypothetical protein
MKSVAIFVFAGVFIKALAMDGAEDLARRYAAYGELIVTHLESAPFPHPSRAEGHKYKEEFFSAADHYSDNTLAIFVPKQFHATKNLDFVVHFHGWKNHVAGVLDRYKLIEQFVESGRNAILVVPQGPRDASDSAGGKLEDAKGFERFMTDVMMTVRQKSSLANTGTSLGHIILSGHSGGYQVISSILDRGGLNKSIKEVWLFDALYAQTEKFIAWAEVADGRLLNIYTDHGGTRAETERMMAACRDHNISFMALTEKGLTLDGLRSNRPVFIYTEMEHNDVLDQHHTFRDFLETSFLSPIAPR